MNEKEKPEPGQSINADNGGSISNVIQAVIHLPAWAWVIGATVVSAALIGMAMLSNAGPLIALLPPQTPLATPTAFAPASETETLIIVAEFKKDASEAKNYQFGKYIFDKLSHKIKVDKLNLRVEYLNQTFSDYNAAKIIGEDYNAALVIWGWYDDYHISSHIERIETAPVLASALADVPASSEAGKIFDWAQPDTPNLDMNLSADLSNQAAYLAFFALGVDEWTKNNFDAALPYLKEALRVALDQPETGLNPSEIYFFRAFIYYKKGDFASATGDLDKAIEHNPNHVYALYNRGLLYAKQENYPQALDDFSNAIQANENNKATETYFDFPAVYNNRGNVYFNMAEYQLAIADFVTATNVKTEHEKSDRAYFNLGLTYTETKDYARAIQAFDEAIRLNPSDADNLTSRGTAYFENGDYAQSIADFNEALALSPANAKIYYNRANAYSQAGQADNAVQDYTQAILLQENYAQAYHERGLVYLETKAYDKAIADLQKALELSPENQETSSQLKNGYVLRGLNYLGVGNYNQAIDDFSEGIKLNQTDGDLFYYRGYCHSERKEYELAIADYNQAISLNPNSDGYYYYRAISFAAIGEKDAASLDLEQALKLTSDAEFRKIIEVKLAELSE
jgi:tetratricopeptide (TPR) repeat protein